MTQKSGRSDFCVICVNFGLSTEERGPKRTIVLPVSSEASRPSVRPSKRPRRTRAIVGTVAALTATTGLYAFAVEPRWVEVTRPNLPPVGRAGARNDVAHVEPSALRVLHLSDLHGSTPGSREAAVLATIAREKPDLVVLTGDTCDTGHFAPYASFLSALHAPLGVFAVEGNWEHWRPSDDEAATLRSAGITLLVNESRRLRDDLWIVGFDDETGGSPDAEKALRGVPAGVTTLALMHSPAFFDSVAGRVTFARGASSVKTGWATSTAKRRFMSSPSGCGRDRYCGL